MMNLKERVESWARERWQRARIAHLARKSSRLPSESWRTSWQIQKTVESLASDKPPTSESNAEYRERFLMFAEEVEKRRIYSRVRNTKKHFKRWLKAAKVCGVKQTYRVTLDFLTRRMRYAHSEYLCPSVHDYIRCMEQTADGIRKLGTICDITGCQSPVNIRELVDGFEPARRSGFAAHSASWRSKFFYLARSIENA